MDFISVKHTWVLKRQFVGKKVAQAPRGEITYILIDHNFTDKIQSQNY